MAFYDWNKDGKKDFQDDFIEYNIYKESTQNNSNNNYNSGGGMSNFGAGCATVASIFIAAGILSVFNLEGAALVIAFIIVVSIVAAIIATFFG
ncbi:MAG: hypothetical protein PUF72_12060 [Clostridiales bacterium]|nr:hypothetical protein [Clostridiales bacterium]